jgi:hypothetical protein
VSRAREAAGRHRDPPRHLRRRERCRSGCRGRSAGARGLSRLLAGCARLRLGRDCRRALAALGYTDVIIRHIVDDQPKVLASYARLAEVKKAVAGV